MIQSVSNNKRNMKYRNHIHLLCGEYFDTWYYYKSKINNEYSVIFNNYVLIKHQKL